MPQPNPELVSFLRENGFSITKQRILVFELLVNSEPLSVRELYELSKDSIDRASLYRTIAVFEQLGIIQRINIGWKYKVELSDSFAEHHHHLTCVSCHKVIPINEAELESFISLVASSHGFMPIEHQVEIQGYCQHCSPEK